MYLEEMEVHAENMVTVMGSIVTVWGPMQPFNEHKNLHFDTEHDIHIIFENHEESDNNLDLDLLTISY